MQVLPAIPHTAADCILELLGYAGHHLAPSMPIFLEAVEGLAPQFAERVDSDLYRSVVCTIRRLPISEAQALLSNNDNETKINDDFNFLKKRTQPRSPGRV